MTDERRIAHGKAAGFECVAYSAGAPSVCLQQCDANIDGDRNYHCCVSRMR